MLPGPSSCGNNSFSLTTYPNKNVCGLNFNSTEFLYMTVALFTAGISKHKRIPTVNTDDGTVVRRQTAEWLRLLALGVSWQTTEQVIKWQVCWGRGQPSVHRACYALSAGCHAWVSQSYRSWAGGGEWWEWLPTSPLRACAAWGRGDLQQRACAIDWNKTTFLPEQ